VVGPTASGKTALGVALAEKYNGEVISADSVQIYKGLDITSAKPTEEEKRGVPHHLIGITEAGGRFSAADYVKLARKKITEITERGKMPIIVGGTGLYINSLLDGINFENAVTDGSVRERLLAQSKISGGAELYSRLLSADPEAADCISPYNLPRVIRALEVMELSGMKFSEYKRVNKAKEPPYNSCVIGLDFADRADLYERINLRVDQMLEAGMLDECEQLFNKGLCNITAIGYKELIPYFEGREELSSCISKIKQNTRRYAKRQLTWFRRDAQINWVYLCNSIIFEKIIDSCEKIVANSKIMCYN